MLRINNSVKQSLWKNWWKPSKEEAGSVRNWLKEYPLEKAYKSKSKKVKDLEVGFSIELDNWDFHKHIVYKKNPNFSVREDYIGLCKSNDKDIRACYFQTDKTKKEIEEYNLLKKENPEYKNKYLLLSQDIVGAKLKILVTKKEQNKRSKVIVYTWIVHKAIPHKDFFSRNYEDSFKEYENFIIGKEVYFRL